MYDVARMIQADIEMQEYLIKKYKDELAKLPDGHLSMRKTESGTYYIWDHKVLQYGQMIRKQEMIRQDNGRLVWQLQMKKLMQEAGRRMERNLTKEKKWIKQYLPYDFVSMQKELGSVYQNISPEQMRRGQYFYSADILELAGNRREVLLGTNAFENAAKDSIKESKRKQIENHASKENEKRTHKENGKKKKDMSDYAKGRAQRTMAGILVRSKSEVILADTLTMLGIPFLYEAEVRLFDKEGKLIVLHPDFTILCPDGTVIYWEHLGMLQDEGYAENFAKKLHLFHRNGFTIGRNLIVTADDWSGHIDSLQIRELAERLILPHMGV